MAGRANRKIAKEESCAALLVGRHVLGESDVLVHLFTDLQGSVRAIARGARKSSKRFAGLEPMHQLAVRFSSSPTRQLATLRESRLERPRLLLTSSLGRLEAAGQGLRWLRLCAPVGEAQPAQWNLINGFLDALDRPWEEAESDPWRARALLASFGLQLLSASGWQLELDACVLCRSKVPSRARVCIDVQSGGIVCRGCGGARMEAGWKQLVAMRSGDPDDFQHEADALRSCALVEKTLRIHGDCR
jgi:DNA repair protein RecO (recombination protein O)